MKKIAKRVVVYFPALEVLEELLKKSLRILKKSKDILSWANLGRENRQLLPRDTGILPEQTGKLLNIHRWQGGGNVLFKGTQTLRWRRSSACPYSSLMISPSCMMPLDDMSQVPAGIPVKVDGKSRESGSCSVTPISMEPAHLLTTLSIRISKCSSGRRARLDRTTAWLNSSNALHNKKTLSLTVTRWTWCWMWHWMWGSIWHWIV